VLVSNFVEAHWPVELVAYITRQADESWINKKHLKNVGPIRYCEPPHAHSPGVACASMSTTTPDNDNA